MPNLLPGNERLQPRTFTFDTSNFQGVIFDEPDHPTAPLLKQEGENRIVKAIDNFI